MVGDDKEKWDKRYQSPSPGQPQPAQVLSDYDYLLPPQGKALDLAAGLGGNALFLARHGLQVSAWDISQVAMEKLADIAANEGVSIDCRVRDVTTEPPTAESFDVIVVSRFLDRSICEAISTALRPAGLLFYQTFTREKSTQATGPSNPDYLLRPNELLQLFPELLVRIYHDEGTVGDTHKGIRNESLLVAQKP